MRKSLGLSSMAGNDVEETDYESDPEEAKLSLKMRRRKEASDDEDEGAAVEVEGKEIDVRMDRPPSSAKIESDVESDGQGAAAEYEDEELDGGELEEEDEEEYYEEEEAVVPEEYEGREGEICSGGLGGHEAVGPEREGGIETGTVAREGSEDQGPIGDSHVEEEKKVSEPFAVPTAGAFYMHDDRCRDNAAGRDRRTFVGRKLWESKDDRKWGHDKFEEMNMPEKQYDERRRSFKGQYRGRGGGRGTNRGYARGGVSRAYDSSSNQNPAPKAVRGRGPRRYQPLSKGKGEGSFAPNKQSTKPIDTPLANSRRVNASMPDSENASVLRKKVASNLSSASPPFYPSSSSSKEITVTQKRDVQTGAAHRSTEQSIAEKGFSMPRHNSMVRGKNLVDSVGMEKLYIDEAVSSAASKHLGNATACTNQLPQSWSQGRGISVSDPASFHPSPMQNRGRKIPARVQVNAALRNPNQNRSRPSPALTQPSGQRPTCSSQGSPPRTSSSITTSESLDLESTPESSKTGTALVAKGKGANQGGGRGSLMYGCPQAIGSSGDGDQNLPSYFPVMQFGGQPGVPALGMAFPGFVGNPQLGLGNSEMTWLPVLAGPAGPLGATYPYLSVDGAYHGHLAGPTSALAGSSKDSSKFSNDDLKAHQRDEPVSDELNQRQSKPRRYSEMNFS